jgi:hypothetical protein
MNYKKAYLVTKRISNHIVAAAEKPARQFLCCITLSESARMQVVIVPECRFGGLLSFWVPNHFVSKYLRPSEESAKGSDGFDGVGPVGAASQNMCVYERL